MKLSTGEVDSEDGGRTEIAKGMKEVGMRSKIEIDDA
jgi:hypothetical protein